MQKDFPLEEYPVFIREGAIIPMNIQRPYTGLGDSTSANYLTWLIYPAEKSEFTIYDTQNQEPTSLTVNQTDQQLTLQLSGKDIPSIFRIHIPQKPKQVIAGNQALKEGNACSYDSRNKKLIIKQTGEAPKKYIIKL